MSTKAIRAEEEILKEAAEAAAVILPALEKRVTALKAILAAAENGASRTISNDDARGRAREHVDAVLKTGGPYREQEIRDLITQRFQAVYTREAIYAVLRRGLKAGRYQRKRRGEWSTG